MRAVVWALPGIACVLVAVTRADEPSMTPAAAAARAREELVKTLYVEFQLTEVVPPGGAAALRSVDGKPKVAVPPAETTLESINRLIIDGEKVRYEDNHYHWEIPSAQSIQVSYVCVFDGSVGKTLYPKGMLLGRTPQGRIEKAPYFSLHVRPELTPITWTFRGLSPGFAHQFATAIKPSGVQLTIDGVSCHQYVPRLTSDWTTSYWIDPEKDHVVRRIVDQHGSRVSDQTDIAYRRHDVWGWVPDSWIRKQYAADGQVAITTTLTVREMRINDPQPAEQFDLQFPEGAVVSEGRSLKTYRAQGDGSLREIDPEIGKDLWIWYRRYKWLLAGFGVVLLLLVILLILGRRRTRAAA